MGGASEHLWARYLICLPNDYFENLYLEAVQETLRIRTKKRKFWGNLEQESEQIDEVVVWAPNVSVQTVRVEA